MLPLLLHLVGYLYYWQMGFNSVFKGLSNTQFREEKLNDKLIQQSLGMYLKKNREALFSL